MRTRTAAAPYVVWMVIFIVVPLLVVAYFAFTDGNGAFTLANLGQIGNFLPTFLDSILLGAIAALICLLIGYPVAYAIAQCKPRAQSLLIMLILLPMCMSFLLRTLAWVELLKDTGIINQLLGHIGVGPLPLIRTRGAVVLGMVYNYLPYMILPLHSILIKIDRRTIEAAQDLGCDKLSVLRKVTLPLSLPGIVSGITMVFVPAVSTFYITKKLGPPTMTLIGDVIESEFKSSYNPNLGAAMSLVLMLMIFICMSVMNKFTDETGEAVLS